MYILRYACNEATILAGEVFYQSKYIFDFPRG